VTSPVDRYRASWAWGSGLLVNDGATVSPLGSVADETEDNLRSSRLIGKSPRVWLRYLHQVASREAAWWGSGSGTTARDRLLAAAETCFNRYGLEKTTLEDIASEAGVSRATVYRHFDGGRDEVILSVVMRDAREFLSALARKVENEATIADAIVRGVLETVSSARKNPRLTHFFAPETAGLTASLAGRSTTLFDLAAEFLGPTFERARDAGQLRPGVEVRDATEFVVRMVLSLLSVPGARRRTAAAQREFVRIYCAGALVVD
jgi:AcrR family transcriptional regulator